jgi:hypothetical protein
MLILLTCVSPADPQQRKPLAVNEISELLKSGVSANRIIQLVEAHGVAFELDDRALQRLKHDAATAPVLSAVKKMSARYAEEKQRIKRQQEEVARRLREEEAGGEKKRKFAQRRRSADLAELERKRQEEAKKNAEEARQRQQDEARRGEGERRTAEEQKRQAEAEKARLGEKQRREDEARLAEEKRRAQEDESRAKAERKKQQEVIAKNKIEEEKRRADARWLLNQMKSGYTAAPNYKDGDIWHFNVIENTDIYSSRALKGPYEIRYSGGRFLVFKEGQRVTPNDSQIGVLLAVVGRGLYMGGQYLNFPLSIGQKWSHQFESESRATRVILYWNSETTVKNVENITTPAGNFWTSKSVRNAWTHRGSKATVTYYYSPQTKTILKIQWEFPNLTRDIELIKLGPGR